MPARAIPKLSFHTCKGFILIDSGLILHCEADGNYSTIHLNGESSLFICKKLKQLELILPMEYFVRVHHSHIINMQYVEAYLHKNGGQLLMSNKQLVPVARRRKKLVLAWFDLE